jgi:hypothetical protein
LSTPTKVPLERSDSFPYRICLKLASIPGVQRANWRFSRGVLKVTVYLEPRAYAAVRATTSEHHRIAEKLDQPLQFKWRHPRAPRRR